MSNIKNRKEDGFTIIEVLIVLAIAGLIMLIVFLAVPALQRNSRNTQIKNAASSVLGAVSEFQNNNGGAMATGASVASDGTVSITGAAGSAPATAKIQGGYAVNADGTMPTTTGTISIKYGFKCASATSFATTGTPRSVSIGYVIETGSGSTAAQCVES